MRGGLALLGAAGVRTFETFFGILLAELEGSAGQIEAGLATLNAQLDLIQRTGQRTFDADAHRLRGELLLKRFPADLIAAEHAFTHAIAIARNQKARILETARRYEHGAALARSGQA
jgi:predicted ATPase